MVQQAIQEQGVRPDLEGANTAPPEELEEGGQVEGATEGEEQEEPDYADRFQQTLADEKLKPFLNAHVEAAQEEAREQLRQQLGPVYQTAQETIQTIRESNEHATSVIVSVGNALIKSLEEGTLSDENVRRLIPRPFVEAINQHRETLNWLRENEVQTAVRGQVEPTQAALHFTGYDQAVRALTGAANRPDLFNKYAELVNAERNGDSGIPLNARPKALKAIVAAIEEGGLKKGLKMRGQANAEGDKVATRAGQGSDTVSGSASGAPGSYSQWLKNHPNATAAERDAVTAKYRR